MFNDSEVFGFIPAFISISNVGQTVRNSLKRKKKYLNENTAQEQSVYLYENQFF